MPVPNVKMTKEVTHPVSRLAIRDYIVPKNSRAQCAQTPRRKRTLMLRFEEDHGQPMQRLRHDERAANTPPARHCLRTY